MSETFVLELPLQVSTADERILRVRFEAGRHLTNACLSEGLRRLSLLRESKEFAKTRALPKDPERNRVFREIKKRFEFTDYALQAFATETKNACWIGEHLDSHLPENRDPGFLRPQTIRSGQGGTPEVQKPVPDARIGGRKKQRGRDPVQNRPGAVEGPVPRSSLRPEGQAWRADPGPRVPGQIGAPGPENRSGPGVLVCAELVMNEIPKWKEKNPVGAGTVGLDLGPSTLAAVSETEALIEVFCPSVSFLSEKIRRISRAMDRSRRATNPDKYNPDGTVKKGPKTWVLSVGISD